MFADYLQAKEVFQVNYIKLSELKTVGLNGAKILSLYSLNSESGEKQSAMSYNGLVFYATY